MKMQSSGSFINYLMANNESIPKVGEYATFLHYTDRTVAIIREVSDDAKTVVLEHCDTMADGKNPMGHQCWKHTPNGNKFTLTWYRNSWRRITYRVDFESEFKKNIPTLSVGVWLRNNDPDLFNRIYGEEVMPANIIPGITKRVKEYGSPIRVLFGACDYYYDWSL